jgi:excisionase family DNA binding protein
MEARKFITVEDASTYLGIKKSTLYSYTHKRMIPFFKPSHKIYFRIEDLNSFVMNEDCYFKSQEQIEVEALKLQVVSS